MEKLEYDSLDYARDGKKIEKTAYIYLPYGYDEKDEQTKYNLVYLMHGWGGHAGEYFDYTATKNVFDHLTRSGDIPPVIIVSATFYLTKIKLVLAQNEKHGCQDFYESWHPCLF